MNNIKILNSFLWKLLERASVQGVSFIVSICLARILQPSEYGEIALVMVFIIHLARWLLLQPQGCQPILCSKPRLPRWTGVWCGKAAARWFKNGCWRWPRPTALYRLRCQRPHQLDSHWPRQPAWRGTLAQEHLCQVWGDKKSKLLLQTMLAFSVR